jgi:hypothetical protein
LSSIDNKPPEFTLPDVRPPPPQEIASAPTRTGGHHPGTGGSQQPRDGTSGGSYRGLGSETGASSAAGGTGAGDPVEMFAAGFLQDPSVLPNLIDGGQLPLLLETMDICHSLRPGLGTRALQTAVGDRTATGLRGEGLVFFLFLFLLLFFFFFTHHANTFFFFFLAPMRFRS